MDMDKKATGLKYLGHVLEPNEEELARPHKRLRTRAPSGSAHVALYAEGYRLFNSLETWSGQ